MSHAARYESDSVGTLAVPADAYYGVNTLRASKNFQITGQRMHRAMMRNLARVKKAAALANLSIDNLDPEIGAKILQACDEVIAGGYDDEFIVDAVQGGAGTSANMNADEVITNMASELAGHRKGDYSICHPNDHVNRSQSTNDVFPTAGRLTVLELMGTLIESLRYLIAALNMKAEEFDQVFKLGRTQMQDAVPIRLGSEFAAASSALQRDIRKLEQAASLMQVVNLGGTAIGTGINAPEAYRAVVVDKLSEVCDLKLKQAENLIDATQNLDDFVEVSGAVKSVAVTLNKFANDLRLLSSGPRTGLNEINLPAVQCGSSIMPGKINPVIPEAVNQVAFNIFGNDVTITMAAANGQLELNAFEPILFYKLFESIDTLRNVLPAFVDLCVTGITANAHVLEQDLENSTFLATVLAPILGYEVTAALAQESLERSLPMRELILEQQLLSPEELERLSDLNQYT